MNAATEVSIRAFKTQLQNREEAAKKLLPLLKPGMNAREVTAILGAPSGMVWQYTLFYSSSMSVRFTGEHKVISVVSDLMREVDFEKAARRDRQGAEIATASSRFKAQPYCRQEQAKELIPFVKPGMSVGEAQVLLGPPNAKYWDYPLVLTGTSSLKVGFDAADNVTQAIIVP